MKSLNGYNLIDANNYDLIDASNVLVAEDKIAETIMILNKKGYLTNLYSVGDLINYNTAEVMMPYIDRNVAQIDKMEHALFTAILIVFKDNYKFDRLPQGFEIVKGTTDLYCKINYFTDNVFELKNITEIIDERNKYLEILNNWAKELPERKDD